MVRWGESVGKMPPVDRTTIAPRHRISFMKDEPRHRYKKEKMLWRVKSVVGTLQTDNVRMHEPSHVGDDIKKQRVGALRALSKLAANNTYRVALLDNCVVDSLVILLKPDVARPKSNEETCNCLISLYSAWDTTTNGVDHSMQHRVNMLVETGGGVEALVDLSRQGAPRARKRARNVLRVMGKGHLAPNFDEVAIRRREAARAAKEYAQSRRSKMGGKRGKGRGRSSLQQFVESQQEQQEQQGQPEQSGQPQGDPQKEGTARKNKKMRGRFFQQAVQVVRGEGGMGSTLNKRETDKLLDAGVVGSAHARGVRQVLAARDGSGMTVLGDGKDKLTHGLHAAGADEDDSDSDSGGDTDDEYGGKGRQGSGFRDGGGTVAVDLAVVGALAGGSQVKREGHQHLHPVLQSLAAPKKKPVQVPHLARRMANEKAMTDLAHATDGHDPATLFPTWGEANKSLHPTVTKASGPLDINPPVAAVLEERARITAAWDYINNKWLPAQNPARDAHSSTSAVVMDGLTVGVGGVPMPKRGKSSSRKGRVVGEAGAGWLLRGNEYRGLPASAPATLIGGLNGLGLGGRGGLRAGDTTTLRGRIRPGRGEHGTTMTGYRKRRQRGANNFATHGRTGPDHRGHDPRRPFTGSDFFSNTGSFAAIDFGERTHHRVATSSLLAWNDAAKRSG